MGWGLMWLLVADARGKRKGGEKGILYQSVPLSKMDYRSFAYSLSYLLLLALDGEFSVRRVFENLPKLWNKASSQILQKWYFLSDFPTPWLLLYAMKTLVFSEKREKVVTSRGWWPSSPWQLRSHFLLRKKVFYDWHPYPPSLPNWEAQRVRGSKRASEEGMTLSYLCRR